MAAANGGKQCVQCSGKKKVRVFADTTTIYVQCNGLGDGSGVNTFSAACGADPKCEGKVVNDVCDTAKKCDAHGACVLSGCLSDTDCAGNPNGPC